MWRMSCYKGVVSWKWWCRCSLVDSGAFQKVALARAGRVDIGRIRLREVVRKFEMELVGNIG